MPVKDHTTTKVLSPKHYKQWTVERGLDPRWVLANVRSVNISEATSLLHYPAKSAGVWIEGCNDQGQFRPDRPWRSDKDEAKKDKRAPKYRTPTGEQYDAILPIHPLNSRYWDEIELRQRCYQVDGYPCLVVVEGGAKAIAGCSNDIPTIGLLGVEMGLTSAKADPQGKRYLVPSLEKLAKTGIGIIFAFDADSKTNPNVSWAQLKLAHQLKKFNIPLYSATGLWSVDEGKGMDDYIQKNGADKFKYEVLGKVVDIETWEKQFRDSLSAEGSNQKPSKPKPNLLAREISEKYREKLAWNIQIREWFQYERKRPGIWEKAPKEGIELIVRAELDVKVHNGYNHRFLTDVINLLKSELMVEEWNQVKGLIPLQNGVLNKATQELKSHSPGYRLTHCLPFKYNKNATCEPIVQWLRETVGGKEDLVEFLLAYLNAVINQRADLQCYLELIGPGGTGKSTYMNLASSLAGKQNTAVTKYQLLETGRFEAAKLAGKLLTLITEADQYVGAVNVLKAITGQDLIPYEEKMKQAGEGFVYEGMVMVAGNEVPKSSDYTSGLHRRRRSIFFRNHISAQKRRDLDKEFKPYLPGLLNLVLSISDERVTQLIRDAEVHCPSIRQFQRESLCETNPIADWLDNKVLRSPNTRYTPSVLYNAYKTYSEETGQKPISLKRFGNLLIDLCQFQLGWKDVEKGRDRQGRFIIGLELRTDEDSSSPFPITEIFNVTDSTKNVTDSVTAETQSVYECDGFDAFLEDSLTKNDCHLTSADENNHVNDLKKPSQCVTPPQPVTQPVTESPDVSDNPLPGGVPKAFAKKRFDKTGELRRIGIPAEYPGTRGHNQTKEPKEIARLIKNVTCKADWEAIENQYGEVQSLWVWRWHFTKQEREELAQIFSGKGLLDLNTNKPTELSDN